VEVRYYFTYQTTNLINGKIYIGVHSTTDINDDYLGSGKFLKIDVKKYGRSNFDRTILKFFNTFEEAYKEECKLLSKEFIDSSSTYNVKLGGVGGWTGGDGGKWTNDRRLKVSERASGSGNCNWKGSWVTPLGTFETSRKAAKFHNISKSTLMSRCRGFAWQYSKVRGRYKQMVKAKGYEFKEKACGS